MLIAHEPLSTTKNDEQSVSRRINNQSVNSQAQKTPNLEVPVTTKWVKTLLELLLESMDSRKHFRDPRLAILVRHKNLSYARYTRAIGMRWATRFQTINNVLRFSAIESVLFYSLRILRDIYNRKLLSGLKVSPKAKVKGFLFIFNFSNHNLAESSTTICLRPSKLSSVNNCIFFPITLRFLPLSLWKYFKSNRRELKQYRLVFRVPIAYAAKLPGPKGGVILTSVFMNKSKLLLYFMSRSWIVYKSEALQKTLSVTLQTDGSRRERVIRTGKPDFWNKNFSTLEADPFRCVDCSTTLEPRFVFHFWFIVTEPQRNLEIKQPRV